MEKIWIDNDAFEKQRNWMDMLEWVMMTSMFYGIDPSDPALIAAGYKKFGITPPPKPESKIILL